MRNPEVGDKRLDTVQKLRHLAREPWRRARPRCPQRRRVCRSRLLGGQRLGRPVSNVLARLGVW